MDYTHALIDEIPVELPLAVPDGKTVIIRALLGTIDSEIILDDILDAEVIG